MLSIMKIFILFFVFKQHPAISECAVMGVPDNSYGEILSAVVVMHEDAAAESKPALTLDTFKSWARERMAPYKVAKHQANLSRVLL